MDLKVRKKKPPLKKNGSMGFALRQWNKVAPEYGFAVTQRKNNQRLSNVKKVVRAMERTGIDWRDKDSWRSMFRKIGQAKPTFEAGHDSKDFKVTFDWAICLRNTGSLVGLVE